jgi:transcriptional regulator with XRE-family HTH domain
LSRRQALARAPCDNDNHNVPKKKDSPTPSELTRLPARLKYARERAGLSGAALAKKSGIDPAQISRYENPDSGRAKGIEAATLIRLAHALGVPVGWLVADEGSLPPVPVFRERPESDGRKR